MESLIIILEMFYCLLQPPALTQSLSPSWRRQFKEILDPPGLEGAEGFDKDPAEQISHWEKPKDSPAMLTRAIAFVRGTGMRFPSGADSCHCFSRPGRWDGSLGPFRSWKLALFPVALWKEEQHARCDHGCCAKGEGAALPQMAPSGCPWQGQDSAPGVL